MMIRGRWNIIIGLACLLLSITISLSTSSKTYAADDDFLPNCVSGSIVWDNLSSTFEVILNCENLVSFSNDISPLTSIGLENSNIIKIQLISIAKESGLFKELSPRKAEIISNELHLTFSSIEYLYNGSLSTRAIQIKSGVLLNNYYGINNDIQIPTANITDSSAPYAADYTYPMSGSKLEVLSADGMVGYGREAEGAIANICVVDAPKFGTVDIKEDGSFIYIPRLGYYGDDSFTYYLIDNAAIGNVSKIATIKIYDALAKIKITNFVNQTSTGSAGYAKLDDIIHIEFESDEPIIIKELKIAGNHIADYQTTDYIHYYADYQLQNTDIEGMIVYFIAYSDRDNPKNEGSTTTEKGIIFDNTLPVIKLANELPECTDDILMGCLEVNTIYDEIITATDKEPTGSPIDIDVQYTSAIDSTKCGIYKIIYTATDEAGNSANLIRNIHVLDSVNDEFVNMANILLADDITNNLASININNYKKFSELYFEKSINGKKIIRVTFLGPIDISDNELSTLVWSVRDRLDEAKIGSVNLNLENISMFDLTFFTAGGVNIQFYNLDKLGYSSGTKLDDVINRLKVSDAAGIEVNSKSNLLQPEVFVGCGLKISDCYTLKIGVKELFNYLIGNDNIVPKVTIYNIRPINVGEMITFSGLIDDSDSQLTMVIVGGTYLIPLENIVGGEWFYHYNSSLLAADNYLVQITASDFANNQRTVSTNLKINRPIVREAETNNSIGSSVYDILSQTATIDGQVDQEVSSIHIIKDNSQEVAAATTINDSGVFGLSWLRLLIISTILSLFGLVSLAIVRKKMH